MPSHFYDSWSDDLRSFIPDSRRSPAALSGRPLRILVVNLLLRDRRPISLGALERHLLGIGLEFDHRASKVISDALRSEVKRGRIRRVSRGHYELAHLAPTTEWRYRRMGQAVTDHLASVAACRQVRQPNNSTQKLDAA